MWWDFADFIRKDIKLILLVTIVAVVIGGVTGKATNVATSCAQLVLTPMALHTSENEKDALAQVLAAPLDVTSLSLLCKNNEVLQQTMDKLNQLHEQGQLSSPINYINVLSTQLKFKVTIAVETPYEVTYTPMLELTAEAKDPHDAEVIVNTWADIVVDAATRFQRAVQSPGADALSRRVADMKSQLEAAELENEKFLVENNLDYAEARVKEIIDQIVAFSKKKNELETELASEKGTLESYLKDEANEKPTLSLNWIPSPELASVLAGKIGAPQEKSETGRSALSVENINSVYWEIRGKIAATRAGVAGKEAQIKDIENMMAQLESERMKAQAEFARVTTQKMRVTRALDRVEQAYKDISSKFEFAQVAGKLDNPALQVISRGTTWPMPRFRRAITFGGTMGFFAFLAAAAASASLRTILRPPQKA